MIWRVKPLQRVITDCWIYSMNADQTKQPACNAGLVGHWPVGLGRRRRGAAVGGVVFRCDLLRQTERTVAARSRLSQLLPYGVLAFLALARLNKRSRLIWIVLLAGSIACALR